MPENDEEKGSGGRFALAMLRDTGTIALINNDDLVYCLDCMFFKHSHELAKFWSLDAEDIEKREEACVCADCGKNLKQSLVKDKPENIELYGIKTAIHRNNTEYKCYLNRVTQEPYVYGDMSLVGYWFNLNYKSLNGKTVANKKRRIRIDISFTTPDEPLLKDKNGNGYMGHFTLNGYDHANDSYIENALFVGMQLTLPIEMFSNLLQLTKEEFIGLEATFDWQEEEPTVGHIRGIEFRHEYNCMYSYIGKFPKKQSDHFHYKI